MKQCKICQRTNYHNTTNQSVYLFYVLNYFGHMINVHQTNRYQNSAKHLIHFCIYNFCLNRVYRFLYFFFEYSLLFSSFLSFLLGVGWVCFWFSKNDWLYFIFFASIIFSVRHHNNWDELEHRAHNVCLKLQTGIESALSSKLDLPFLCCFKI